MINYKIQSHFIPCVDKLTCLTLTKQENNWLNNGMGLNEFLGANTFSVKLRGKSNLNESAE